MNNRAPLADLAAHLQTMGEGDDTVLAHIHPLEAAMLDDMFGSSGINPETGLPQYGFGLKSIGKSIKKVGKKVVGGVKKVANKVGDVAGDIARKTSGIPGLNALTSQLALLDDPDDFIKIWKTKILPEYGVGAAGALATTLGANPAMLSQLFGGKLPGGGIVSGLGSLASSVLPLLAAGGAGALIGSQLDDKGNSYGVQKDIMTPDQQALFNKPSTQLDMTKLQQDATPSGLGLTDYVSQNWNKFSQGQYNQLAPSAIPPQQPVQQLAMGGLATMATGGSSRHVMGPGDGREDKIQALLSNNEYVVDAETVSLLGNGSPDAGAKRLDDMRSAVRRHKGSALAKGKISPNAKSPLMYLTEGSK